MREDLRPSPTAINNELSINCDSQLTLGEKQQLMLLPTLLPEGLYDKRFTCSLKEYLPHPRYCPIHSWSSNKELRWRTTNSWADEQNWKWRGKNQNKRPNAPRLMEFAWVGELLLLRKINSTASIAPWLWALDTQHSQITPCIGEMFVCTASLCAQSASQETKERQ